MWFILWENDLLAILSAHLDFPLIFYLSSWPVFLDIYYRYVFHILDNESAFVFIFCENYFLCFIGFKKVDFVEVQTVHNDICVAILFTNATPLIFYYLFSFYKLTSRCFFLFSDIVYHSFFIIWQHFLTIHFKHFVFIEWFDLNSNSKSLFEISSIKYLFYDCWMFNVHEY